MPGQSGRGPQRDQMPRVREHHDATHYARVPGYAPRALSWAVCQATGRAAKAYTVDRIVLEARRLTAAGCVRALGFPDASDFSVFFLNATGTRPGRWRAQADPDRHGALNALICAFP